MLKPAILVRDPDLIRNITTTDFYSFHRNDVAISKRYDPLSANDPAFAVGDKWRESRKTMSPMFSQSKVNTVMKFVI